MDVEMLSKALMHAFRSSRAPDILEQSCKERKQRINESVQSYVYEFLALLKDFNQNLTEAEKSHWLTNNTRTQYKNAIHILHHKTVDIFLNLMPRHEEIIQSHDNDDTLVQQAHTTAPTLNNHLEIKIDTLASILVCQQQMLKKVFKDTHQQKTISSNNEKNKQQAVVTNPNNFLVTAAKLLSPPL